MIELEIQKFLKECGFHDNRIISIQVTEYDVVIRIDDFHSNMRCEGWPPAPGYIIIRKCNRMTIDHLVSNWIVDGGVNENGDNSIVWLVLNTGARFEAHGEEVVFCIDGDAS